MNTQDIQPRLYRMGCIAFFFSGICAMSSGVVVSLLQEHYGFAYGMTGTLLSLMNVGNLVAGFASGVLPSKIGTRNTVLMLGGGLCAGLFFYDHRGLFMAAGTGIFDAWAGEGLRDEQLHGSGGK